MKHILLAHTFFIMSECNTANSLPIIPGTNLENIIGTKTDTEALRQKHIKVCQNNGFTLLKYDKDQLTEDNTASLGRIRSVILQDDDLVSFAPIKSMPKSQYMNLGPGSHVVEEFIDGTMINCFYDKRRRQWEYATRSVVGADTQFFDESDMGWSLSFKKMFRDTFSNSQLRWDMFNREYCYSFVLQHPRNRIVVPVQRPTLWLIEVYDLSNRRVRLVDTSAECFRELLNHVRTPYVHMVFETATPEDYEAAFGTFIDELEKRPQDHRKMGFVVRSGLVRYKFRYPAYEYVKRLRGNNSKLQYQYYSLRKTGTVKEFLKYFPEYRWRFAQFRDVLHEFTNHLWNNYMLCFVHHQLQFNRFPAHFRRHMFALHDIYLQELLPRKWHIDQRIVIDYVNSRHPSDLLHTINHHS